ncbi:hypothetical protein Glove_364g7 [Diversispora epigaea]|uniref:Uncharacterized protein n=1 Tax=Diversispora epigaea TaxID=1348612 RepID=A0A397H8E6_9GLOM|nr:hypothetical protein Glove_364g7 [Diversispora epigaea]
MNLEWSTIKTICEFAIMIKLYSKLNPSKLSNWNEKTKYIKMEKLFPSHNYFTNTINVSYKVYRSINFKNPSGLHLLHTVYTNTNPTKEETTGAATSAIEITKLNLPILIIYEALEVLVALHEKLDSPLIEKDYGGCEFVGLWIRNINNKPFISMKND